MILNFPKKLEHYCAFYFTMFEKYIGIEFQMFEENSDVGEEA